MPSHWASLAVLAPPSPKKGAAKAQQQNAKSLKPQPSIRVLSRPPPTPIEPTPPIWSEVRFAVGIEPEGSESTQLYTVTLSHSGGSLVARKTATDLHTLHRDLTAEIESQKLQPQKPLPSSDLLPTEGAEVGEKERESLQLFFDSLPEDAFTLASFRSFFESSSQEGTVAAPDNDSNHVEDDEGEDEIIVPDVPEGLNCTNAKIDAPVQYVEGWDYLDDYKKIRALTQGKVFFTFACHSATTLTDKEKLLIDSVVNLSGFEDETKDNEVPLIDIYDPVCPPFLSQYTQFFFFFFKK